MDLTPILEQLQPVLTETISVLIGAALLFLANLIRQKTGLDIEARHRDALHRALMSGVTAGLRDGPDVAKDVLITRAVEYAKSSVPDAIRKLKPEDFVLRKLAESKVGEVLARIDRKG